MKCWSCGNGLEAPPNGRIPFRAVCDFCTSWLHCCKNCTHYAPGKPNDCKVPGTETIADRETSNFCEEFTLMGQCKKSKGNAAKNEANNKFHNLFKDE